MENEKNHFTVYPDVNFSKQLNDQLADMGVKYDGSVYVDNGESPDSNSYAAYYTTPDEKTAKKAVNLVSAECKDSDVSLSTYTITQKDIEESKYTESRLGLDDLDFNFDGLTDKSNQLGE